jgi:hypothetical protein
MKDVKKTCSKNQTNIAEACNRNNITPGVMCAGQRCPGYSPSSVELTYGPEIVVHAAL